jgi:hypothetical protein
MHCFQAHHPHNGIIDNCNQLHQHENSIHTALIFGSQTEFNVSRKYLKKAQPDIFANGCNSIFFTDCWPESISPCNEIILYAA